MKLKIIVGSTREGRVTDRVAKWVAAMATDTGSDIEILDLRDFDLPFFNEALSPQYNPNRVPRGAVKRWLDALADADAYVLVTPEYNRSYPAVLKNALDYIDFQMEKKPVALVAHGSSGGAQAVSHLRGCLAGLLAITVPRATFIIGPAGSVFTEDGRVDEAARDRLGRLDESLKATLADLRWYGDTLAIGRTR